MPAGLDRTEQARVDPGEVTMKEIAIVGYIVESNLAAAPACALHKTGQKDPEGCRAEIPTFAIADTKDARDERKIRVMGWASNWANVFEANRLYKDAKAAPAVMHKDAIWAVDVPYPLPAVGAKVRVRVTVAPRRSPKATSRPPAMPPMLLTRSLGRGIFP